MRDFLCRYEEVIRTCGDSTAFSDGTVNMTYAALDEASAKIYSYLKEKSIGREDFVQVVLKRGVTIPAAVIGIVKAGAAFVVLEDTYPADRTDFIYKDCGCVLRIDNDLYEKIMKTQAPLSGAEETDPHDACYAVYTSGSTGNPKGVLHEYGNIEQGYMSFATWYDDSINNAAIFAPFYFVAGIIDIFHYITRKRTTYLIPHDMTRDFVAVKKFIVDNNIEEMFLPPSYLRIYTEPSPTLKVLYTGSEPANGLTYNNSPTLINFYAMSESGFVVLQANLDKAYPIAPVGKSLLEEIAVRIIDEDGKVIEGSGQGELCFVNEYIRGYINLPDQTAKVFRDGLFHTNDCVRRDDDGNYYVVGRFDDMIKINGNRVEPVEIENQIKKLTGLTSVVAKGFSDNNRAFICAYFLEDEASALGIFKDKTLDIDSDALKKNLPDYMIPTYYVALKSFPLLPNGKIARKNLVPPKTDDIRNEYVAPTTQTEKVICEMFAQVLKLEKSGVNDDFFTCGGDSMSSIVLAAKFSEAGLHIDTAAIYSLKTPAALAAYYEKNRDKLDKVPESYDNSKALEVPNYSGKAFLKQTKEGQGGIFSYHMTEPVDPKALQEAFSKVLTDYPFFALTFEERDDKLYYKELGYIPEVKPLSELDRTDHTGKPLIEPYYDGNTITISYFHVLTDGEGFFFFASTLLHEYIGIMNNTKEEQITRHFDHAYDVMAQKIDTDARYITYDLPATFVPPEYDRNKIRVKTVKLSLDRRDWQQLVANFINETGLSGIRELRSIGGADAFVAGYLYLKAVAEVHPDAKDTLMCRFPINMRYALGRENTLRNCAMPQAFYNVNAVDLLKDRTAAAGAFERIAEMTSKGSIEVEVNRLVDFLTDPEKDIADDPVYNYIINATVLATNLGNIASVGDAGFVKDFSINFKPTCYMSIQTCIKGDEQVLIINQLFDDEAYVKQFINDISYCGNIRSDIKS